MPEQEAKGKCEVCNKPAKQFCSSCKAVFYCSKDCQKRGWKEHKTKCRPFTMLTSPIYGRYLAATRDIKPGEVLLKEAPMLVGPKQKSGPLCLGCHRAANPNDLCSKCGYPSCGSACEFSKIHQMECPILRASPKRFTMDESTSQLHPAYSCLMALRCVLMKTHDPKTWQQLNNLQGHVAEIKKGELYQFFKTNVVDYIRKYLGYDQVTEDELFKMCGILTTNSFEVKHNGSRVRGLYNFASKMAHSCVANTKHVFENDLTVVFISTVKIPKGASITVNYTQVLWNTMARRQHLKMLKFFLCECPRCSDPTELGTHFSTLTCDSCGKGSILSKEPLNIDGPWACTNCSHVLSSKQVRWGDAVLFRELRELDKSTPIRIENFLAKYKKSLHPHHRFFAEAKYALIKMYGNTAGCRYRDMTRAQLESKVQWCRELLDLSTELDPGLSLFRGSVLLELQATIVALAKHLLSNDIITNDGAKDYMKEAADVLQEASIILKHEPEMRDGGLNDRLTKLSEELEI